MLIADIIPYSRNARHNEKAIPAVADSIREFGLRGQIVLESREKPVIVTGHTRVAACKSLGWQEIPDENIAYCDGLTEEQIKAYRIADNKTGEISTWNKGLLQSEIKAIKSVDMARFGCDFKSKHLKYGAERLRTDRAYNLDIINRSDCNGAGYPELKKVMVLPKEMTAFHYAKEVPENLRKETRIHFFIDDYRFERLWNSPNQYLDLLKQYKCVCTPDFSLYMDMPAPMQAWNHYRSQALGKHWQNHGIKAVPTLSWAQPDTYPFCLEGIPKGGTVAVSTVGIHNNEQARAVFFDGMAYAMETIKPKRILLYGKNIGFDFGAAEVVEFKNTTSARFGRKAKE